MVGRLIFEPTAIPEVRRELARLGFEEATVNSRAVDLAALEGYLYMHVVLALRNHLLYTAGFPRARAMDWPRRAEYVTMVHDCASRLLIELHRGGLFRGGFTMGRNAVPDDSFVVVQTSHKSGHEANLLSIFKHRFGQRVGWNQHIINEDP